MEIKKHPEKHPGKKSAQGFLIGLITALALTLVAFEWKSYTLKVPISCAFDYTELPEEEMPIVILKNQRTPPPPPEVSKALPPELTTPEPLVIPDPTPAPKPTSVDMQTVTFDPEPLAPEPVGITQFPSVQPEFQGGIEGLYAYLGKHIQYPKAAKDMGVEGKVYLQFIVNTDGSISEIKVLRAQNKWLTQEAIRVVKGMPKWTPGRQGGRKVRVIYTLPIIFALK